MTPITRPTANPITITPLGTGSFSPSTPTNKISPHHVLQFKAAATDPTHSIKTKSLLSPSNQNSLKSTNDPLKGTEAEDPMPVSHHTNAPTIGQIGLSSLNKFAEAHGNIKFPFGEISNLKFSTSDGSLKVDFDISATLHYWAKFSSHIEAGLNLSLTNATTNGTEKKEIKANLSSFSCSSLNLSEPSILNTIVEAAVVNVVNKGLNYMEFNKAEIPDSVFQFLPEDTDKKSLDLRMADQTIQFVQKDMNADIAQPKAADANPIHHQDTKSADAPLLSLTVNGKSLCEQILEVKLAKVFKNVIALDNFKLFSSDGQVKFECDVKSRHPGVPQSKIKGFFPESGASNKLTLVLDSERDSGRKSKVSQLINLAFNKFLGDKLSVPVVDIAFSQKGSQSIIEIENIKLDDLDLPTLTGIDYKTLGIDITNLDIQIKPSKEDSNNVTVSLNPTVISTNQASESTISLTSIANKLVGKEFSSPTKKETKDIDIKKFSELSINAVRDNKLEVTGRDAQGKKVAGTLALSKVDKYSIGVEFVPHNRSVTPGASGAIDVANTVWPYTVIPVSELSESFNPETQQLFSLKLNSDIQITNPYQPVTYGSLSIITRPSQTV